MICFRLTLIFTLFSLYVCSATCLEFKYHTQNELETLLYKFSEDVTEPLQAKVYSIGKTNEDRDILVFELTAAQDNSEIVPNIQLSGNIHGNEPPGREILLHYIEYLIVNYQKDDRIQWLLNNTRIFIIPCLNPDGWAIAEPDCVGVVGRYNAKKFDLNRNFPDYISEISEIDRKEQIETTAIRNFKQNVSFVLSGDIHAGAIVTIYPFHRLSYTKFGYEIQSSITPDNNIFQHLAHTYAKNNAIMHQQSTFCDNETFPGGITRGAEWYYFLGGMQDYSYMAHGTMALTFEISCCKYPPAEMLAKIWEQNRKSLDMFCSEANRGVTALIKDSKTDEPISSACVTVLGIDKVFLTNLNGRFWKILLPGKYYLRVEKQGYETVENTFTVDNENDEFPKLTVLEIEMNPM